MLLKSPTSTHSNNSSATLETTDGARVVLEPQRSFSIHFRGVRTLDCMTIQDDHRDPLLEAFNVLLRAYQEAKTKVGNEILLLRYIWLDVDQQKTGLLPEDKLASVLQRINLYKKRRDLHNDYLKFGRVLGLDRGQRRKGLTFDGAG
ncbi:MAG: hypothetical protein AAGJ35_16070 [Myxococcota bacterium]